MVYNKMFNENNPMWKGNDAGYTALHDWVRTRIPKPEICENCQQRPSYDLANKSGQYKRDLTDWGWLCRKCHMESDGRMVNLKRNPKTRTPESIREYLREWHLKHRKEQLEYMRNHWKIFYSNPENREKYKAMRREHRRKKRE